MTTWCWLCSLGGGSMCLIGGEGEENMGGGGITPISVTPKLSCRSPEKDDVVKKMMRRRMLLTIMLGVPTRRYPLIGINREGVDCLCHWKYFRQHFFGKFRKITFWQGALRRDLKVVLCWKSFGGTSTTFDRNPSFRSFMSKCETNII